MKYIVSIILLFFIIPGYGQQSSSIFGNYNLVYDKQFPEYTGPIQPYQPQVSTDTYNNLNNRSYVSAPRQAKGKTESGSASATVNGVTVIVRWTATSDENGKDALWTVVYDPPGKTEYIVDNRGGIKTTAQAKAEEIATKLATEQSSGSDTPIGAI